LTLADQSLSVGLLSVAVTAVAGSCALWWTYFGWAREALEDRMEAETPKRLGRYARDVYSFAHFPLIFGVIGFAVGIEEAIAHPKDPFSFPGALALCLGVALILGGTGLALTLARVPVPPVRWWAVVVLIVAVPLVQLIPAWVSMTIVSVLVAGLAAAEEPSQHDRGTSEATV